MSTSYTAALPSRGQLPMSLTWWALISLIINLGLAWGINALLLQNVTSVSPVSGFIMMIIPSLVALLVTTAAVTLMISAVTNEPVRWLDVVGLYLVANLAHLISGTYAIVTMMLYGVPGPGEAMTISLNLGNWTNGFGGILSLASVDEVLHLGIFVTLMARFYRLRSAFGLALLVFVPWALFLIGWSAFLGQFGR